MQDVDEEFTSADYNYVILLKEMTQEIKSLQNDLQVITNDEVRGFAKKRYMELKNKYFYLLAKDLELLKLYENDNKQEGPEDGFVPM